MATETYQTIESSLTQTGANNSIMEAAWHNSNNQNELSGQLPSVLCNGGARAAVILTCRMAWRPS